MKTFLITFILTTFLTGCSFFTPKTQENAVETMLQAKETIIIVAQAADEACTRGILTQSQCDEIAKTYMDARGLYDITAESLELAILTGSKDFWQNYQTHHADFYQLYNLMISLSIKTGLLKGVQ